MSFKEIMELKDEILKNNRELEIRLKNQIENYNTKFTSNISNFQKKINTMNENNNKVMNSIPNINFNISKINEIEKFDMKVDNRLTSHDIRITTILTEIEKIKTKYDKIILDNLYVPGHVGGRCKFSNLSEYLLCNINDVSLLKLETEQLKKDTKAMKNKHENTIKQIVNVIDGSVKRCNEYTDNKQKDFQLLLDTKMREFNDKIMEIRMNVCKIQMKTEEEYNHLNIEFNKLFEEKKEFTNFFQNKLMEIQDELSNLQKDYKTNINDIKQKNKNIGKDVQNIKDNINNLIKLIKYYQKKEKKNNNNKYDLNIPSDDEKKAHKIIGNRANLMKEFENSNNKMINIYSSVAIKNSNMQKQRKNSMSKINIDSKNNNNNSKHNNNNGEIRRKIKKRNTMFYTGPILNLQNNNKALKETNQINSPTFFGLINPILHKIIEGSQNEDLDNNKDSSFSNFNNNNEDMINNIYSDRIPIEEKEKENNEKNKDKNNNSNKDQKIENKNNDKSNNIILKNNNNKEGKNNNNKNDINNDNSLLIIHSNFSSKFDSGENSDSDSNSNHKNEIIDENNAKKNNNIYQFSRRKKKSNSKQYSSKLKLNNVNYLKKSSKSNSKLLRIKTYNNSKFKNQNSDRKKKIKNIIDDNKNKIYSKNIDQKEENKNPLQSDINKLNKDLSNILDKKFYLNSKNIPTNENSLKEINENKNIKNSLNYIINNKNKIINNKYYYTEDSKINNNKINLKNNNLSKIENKNIEKSQNNLNNIKSTSNNINIIKNASPKLKSRNNNQANNNSLNPIISTKLNNIPFAQKYNIIYSNNYSNTINVYSSFTKNHKINSVLTPEKDKGNIKTYNIQKNNILQSQKNIEIDSDTGIGYNIVSFDIPENVSLPPKTNQYYPLFGKKLHKKPQIKADIISPLDEIYRQQFNKKIKLESLSNSNFKNDIPKKISPVFGRTAYAFYSKKDIEEFGGSTTNSVNLKGNNNANKITNNLPINIKYFSNGKKKYINENEDL